MAGSLRAHLGRSLIGARSRVKVDVWLVASAETLKNTTEGIEEIFKVYAAHKLSQCLTRERTVTAEREGTSRRLPPRRCLSVFPGSLLAPRGPWNSSPPPLRCWRTRTRLTSPLRSVFTRLRRLANAGIVHTLRR